MGRLLVLYVLVIILGFSSVSAEFLCYGKDPIFGHQFKMSCLVEACSWTFVGDELYKGCAVPDSELPLYPLFKQCDPWANGLNLINEEDRTVEYGSQKVVLRHHCCVGSLCNQDDQPPNGVSRGWLSSLFLVLPFLAYLL